MLLVAKCLVRTCIKGPAGDGNGETAEMPVKEESQPVARQTSKSSTDGRI